MTRKRKAKTKSKPRRPRMTLVALIEKAKPERIVAETIAAGDKKITLAAVHKWRTRGIPSSHWGVITELTGVPLDEIYAINEDCKRSKRAA